MKELLETIQALPVLGFLSGVGVSLTGAFLANMFARKREQDKARDEHRFSVYMKLMEIHSFYFWYATAEVHKERVPPDIQSKCQKLSWEIADMLRAADDLEHLDEILDVLMGPDYPSAVARYEQMGVLLGKLGKRVNPRYQKKIGHIGTRNVMNLGVGHKNSTAPGSTLQVSFEDQ